MSEAPGRGVRSFIVDNLFVGLAQLLTKVRGLVLIPLLVKGLGVESYGVYAQVISFVGLVGGLLALNVHLPFIQFAAEDRKRAGSLLTTLILSLIVSVGLGSTLLYVLAGDRTRDLLVATPDPRFFVVALCMALAAANRLFLLNAYRATDRIKLRSTLDFLGTLVEIGGAVVLVVAGFGLYEVLLFSAAWGLVFDLGCFVHVASILGVGPLDRSLWIRALRYSLPLVPASLALWALDRADRFLLNAFLGEREVGLYSARYAWASLAGVVLAPLQITLVPKVAQLWASERPRAFAYLTTSIQVFLAASIGVAAFLTVSAPEALRLLASPEVAEGSTLVTLLISTGAVVWGATIIQSLVFYATHGTGKVGLINVVAALVNVACNLALIPVVGGLGSAIATTLGYATAFALTLLLTRRVFPASYGWFLVRCVAGACFAGAPSVLLVRWGYPFAGGALVGLLYLVALLGLRVFTTSHARRVVERLRRRPS